MKPKVPTASKSHSVVLVLWPTRVLPCSMHSVPSTCFMGQLVPSLRCYGCSVPSSISLGHAHTQLSANKLLCRAHALHATCPTEGVSTIQTSSSQVWSYRQSQSNFPNNTKLLFAFFTHFVRVYSGVF